MLLTIDTMQVSHSYDHSRSRPPPPSIPSSPNMCSSNEKIIKEEGEETDEGWGCTVDRVSFFLKILFYDRKYFSWFRETEFQIWCGSDATVGQHRVHSGMQRIFNVKQTCSLCLISKRIPCPIYRSPCTAPPIQSEWSPRGASAYSCPSRAHRGIYFHSKTNLTRLFISHSKYYWKLQYLTEVCKRTLENRYASQFSFSKICSGCPVTGRAPRIPLLRQREADHRCRIWRSWSMMSTMEPWCLVSCYSYCFMTHTPNFFQPLARLCNNS